MKALNNNASNSITEINIGISISDLKQHSPFLS